MPNYLMLALDSALSVFGIRSIYEQPRYEVTERIGAVEIRAMRFFLPGKITRDDAPVPTDARVKIVQVPEETIAALTFSGRGTEAVLTEKKCALVDGLAVARDRRALHALLRPTLHNPVFAPERRARAGSDARLGRAAAGKSAPASSMHSEHLPVHQFEPQHRLELWRKQCNAVS
jgi:hypothetical protein